MAKKLEKWQIDDANRLLSLVTPYMEDNRLSQSALMDKLGYTQGMFFQIFGGKGSSPGRPLSFEHAYAFANLLNVNIDAISPILAEKIFHMSKKIDATGAINIDALPGHKYKIEVLGAQEFKNQLNYFFDGMSPHNKEAIVLIANKLYEIDHPEDSLASGKKQKNNKVDKSKQINENKILKDHVAGNDDSEPWSW